MAETITHSVEETVAFGRRLSAGVDAGTIFALDGDLGAGKTQLARGLAQGAGYDGRVQSPSYGLINIYEGGRLTVFHLDLYRLESPDEIIGAGLEEYLIEPTGIVAVEWASRWFDRPNAETHSHLQRLRLETISENERRIIHEPART